MTDHDDVLKALDAALQVEPSHAFADGVRARVIRSRVNTTRVWWGLAAAASIGLATMALWRPSVEVPATMPTAPTQASVPAAPSANLESVVASDVTTPSLVHRVAPVARRAPTAPEPRLEVITNQGALLRELWAGVGTGGMVETVMGVAAAVPSVEVKPIAPIVVDPIVVTPIVVSELGKEAGPAGATPVIRRVDAAGNMR